MGIVHSFYRLPNHAALALGWLECDGLNSRQEETDLKQRQILSGSVTYSKGRNRPKRPDAHQLSEERSVNIFFIELLIAVCLCWCSCFKGVIVFL